MNGIYGNASRAYLRDAKHGSDKYNHVKKLFEQVPLRCCLVVSVTNVTNTSVWNWSKEAKHLSMRIFLLEESGERIKSYLLQKIRIICQVVKFPLEALHNHFESKSFLLNAGSKAPNWIKQG